MVQKSTFGFAKALANKEWVDEHHDAVQAACGAAFPDGIEAYGELKTATRGYSVDHPVIAYLRMTGLGTRAKLTKRQVCADDLVDRLIPIFRAVKPMVTFLDTGACPRRHKEHFDDRCRHVQVSARPG